MLIQCGLRCANTYSISQYLSKDIILVVCMCTYKCVNICEYDEAWSRFLNNYILYGQKKGKRKEETDSLTNIRAASLWRGHKKLKIKKPWLDSTYTHSLTQALTFYSICFKMETIRSIIKNKGTKCIVEAT